MRRSLYLLLLLVTPLVGCGGSRSQSGESVECPDCNVLLITVDTLRADHLPCYGYSRNTAPNICALAEKGIRFDNAVSQSSWTLPAHASIMTGVYPNQHQAENLEKRIDDRLPMLAEILAAEGYSSSAFVSHDLVGEIYGFARGFDTFDATNAKGHDWVSSPGLTDLACTWLAGNRNKFFTWVHYFDPHDRFVYHDDSALPYPKGVTARTRLRYSDWNSYPFPHPVYVEARRSQFLALYDGEIAFVDRHVGRLLECLEATGQRSRTVVIVTSDHGEAFGEHGLVGHDNLLYRVLLRVPLILHIPGTDAAVRVSPVETRSIAATTLELLKLDKPDHLGSGLFDGDTTTAYAEVHHMNQHRRLAAVHDGWKLIYTMGEGRIELYNLKNDPEERLDLASKRSEIALELQQDLFSAMGIVDLDDETVKRLSGLGYLQ